jgi:cytochrome c oxidase subunit 2
MNTERKETTYRIGGMLGLAALLGVVLWARQPRRPEPPAHDHADPAQHGHAVEGRPLAADATGHLQPSGRVEDGVRVVDYDAFQYGFAPDPLIVRASEPIRLAVKSRDVAHGVMIPEVEFSTDMPKDRRKTAEFVAPAKPGEYPVFCSVFCGPGHGNMTGRLIVLPAMDDTKRHHD